MVFIGVNLQPCFATEELVRPTSGKEEGSRGKEGISNKL